MAAPLRLAFYGEGPTDDRFLPAIVERTVRKILNQRARYEVDVFEPYLIPRSVLPTDVSGEERILQAAREAAGYHALIVHMDADAPDGRKARMHRFEPAVQLVDRNQGDLCRRLVPVVPVRMSESWMIADWETLAFLLNPTLNWEQLRLSKAIDLPQKPHESETDPTPKETLKRIIAYSQSHRRRASREVNLQNIQTQMGQAIQLEVLEKVPSYSQFAEDMAQTLVAIGMAK